MGVTDGLAALRGAVGFLSRLPIGRNERDWEAFTTAPWTLPVAGYALGALLALVVAPALVVALPAPTIALVYLVVVVVLTGINHADGVADLGDAVVVHGGPERRREVMGDTVIGVGGTLALGLIVAGLALAGLSFSTLPLAVALGLLVTAEAGAKLAMAVLITVGSPAHEGFGAAVAGDLDRRHLVVPAALAMPAIGLPGSVVVGGAALAGAIGAAVALLWWSRRQLGGVSGDVFGAANELARVVALHAGLAAWHVVDTDGRFSVDLWPWVTEVVAWTPW